MDKPVPADTLTVPSLFTVPVKVTAADAATDRPPLPADNKPPARRFRLPSLTNNAMPATGPVCTLPVRLISSTD